MKTRSSSMWVSKLFMLREAITKPRLKELNSLKTGLTLSLNITLLVLQDMYSRLPNGNILVLIFKKV